MHFLILWSGFIGAWLLLAGPIYQAAIELDEEDIEREAIASVTSSVQLTRSSPWWWLLPPVAYVLRRRRSQAYRREVLQVLTPAQVEQVLSYRNKASGWLFVGSGAFFIAIKETWELTEANDWPLIIFVVLIVLMATAATGLTVVRMRRTHDIVEHTSDAAGSSGGGNAA